MSRNGHPQFPNENYVSAWRELRKLTQAKLAEKIGTNGSVISLLEAGHRQLSPKWLRRISGALDVPVGYLLEHHPDSVPSDLLEIWAQVPEAKREDALNILRSLSIDPKTGTKG